jgi:hypothetical protein
MPIFRFQAMDSVGEVHKDQIEAADSDEAMRLLGASGLFVTALRELTNRSDEANTCDSSATASECVPSGSNIAESGEPRQGRGWGVVVTAVGLACAGLELYGVIDSIWFGIGAERASATVVGVLPGGGDDDVDVLELDASDGRRYRVEARGAWRVLWATNHGLNVQVPVLYPADSPEEARLADFAPRFATPLIPLVLGCLLTPAGLLVWRYGWRPVEA